MFTLNMLQDEQRAWVKENFPSRESVDPLFGAVEELGELAHAHLKMRLGIRGDEQTHRDNAADAVADVIIFLEDYCSAMGFDLQTVVEETWARVRIRDWVQYPINGSTE